MNHVDIYRKAIKELHHKTRGKLEHDEHIAIELFDKLLDKDISSHCDTIKILCLEAGYEKLASEDIAKIYDIISLYKKPSITHWDIDKLLDR